MYSLFKKAIDLTHNFDKNMPLWVGKCGFRSRITLDYQECVSDVKFRVQDFSMNSGIGTHIDAPAHRVQGGRTVESIPIEELFVKAFCIDVSSHADEYYLLSVEEILEFEENNGDIARDSFVIIHTGWSRFWDKPYKYKNFFQFPSISIEAAELLLDRGIVGLGIDTLSPDVITSGFEVHNAVLSNDKYIVENITNASYIPSKDFYVSIMPLKGYGLVESPARVVAYIPNNS